MPKLSEFGSYATAFQIKVKAAGAMSVSAALDEGKNYMRLYIAEGSPTGSEWHDLKNDTNGYSAGSRMGNMDSSIGPTHTDAGNMFRSVQSEDATVKGSNISGRFGWISNQEGYFLQQDSGHYKTGKQMGMGLINTSHSSSRGVLQELGAAVASEEALRSTAISKGFKISGGSSWL